MNFDVNILFSKMRTFHESGKNNEALEYLTDLWNKLPDPKTEILNSFLIIRYAIKYSEKINNLDLAWSWAERGIAYSGNFNLGGESELLAADIAFKKSDFEQAAKYLKTVKKMSGMRFIKDLEPEMKKLLN